MEFASNILEWDHPRTNSSKFGSNWFKEEDFLAIFYLTLSPTSLEFSGLPLRSADEFRKIEIRDMPNILQKNG